MTNHGPALAIRNLHVSYRNGNQALAGLELDVHHGECVAVVGESGCGKTTLARAILGLLPAAAAITGSIQLGAEQLLPMTRRELRRLLGNQIGYVAQDPYAACDPLRTVGHHVAEAWRAKGSRPPHDEIAIKLAAVGIGEAEQRLTEHPHQWSGGMLQRATILAATAHGPTITIADEPTSALDAELADGVLETLRRACPTLLLISHDLRLVAKHADRIAVIHDGQIVEVGPTEQLIENPQHPYTRLLLATAGSLRSGSGPVAVTHTQPVVLVARNLHRSYRNGTSAVRAVSDVAIAINRGELLGLAGPSGSGKSTLLRLLSGIEPADLGTITYTDAGLSIPPPGYVMPIFQDPVASLDRRWPLWRTVTEPLTRARRLSKSERIQHALRALEQVKLADLDPTLLPGQLSVGQCQRVAIARALIASPTLVIADEPTASLDVTTAAEIIATLREVAQQGTAMLIVSHDLPLLTSLVDRVIHLERGRLVQPITSGADR